MPASRSRNDRWRESLEQVRDRGGVIELAIERRRAPRPEEGPRGVPPADLLWRVRLLSVEDSGLTVETPGAAGRRFPIAVGTPLIGVLSVGQNKWMFHTAVVQADDLGQPPTLRLRLPDGVERATRRTQQRISTAALSLPAARCWVLLDPASAVPAQSACRGRVRGMLEQRTRDESPAETLDLLGPGAPDVGAGFRAELANIGGGGVGLVVARDDAAHAQSTRLYWTRLDLRPHTPAPIEFVSRLAHTHIDAMQNVYAGMAFEFDIDPDHRAFMIDMIQRTVRALERDARPRL